MTRLIIEFGTGADLYGGDYTKAACRAVRDAIGHSSLSLFSSCGYDHRAMTVKVTIGVQNPEAVDGDVVAASLPRGNPEVHVVKGGQNIANADRANTDSESPTIIAAAAVEAFLEIDPKDWKLRESNND